MTAPSIERIAELQALIAQFAQIDRALRLPNTQRHESDTDHSFGLALTCWYLQPKIAPELDLLEIFKIALAHDLVEIEAGDTFVFDESGKADKSDREHRAIAKLRSDWPDFSEMAQYAQLYDEKATEEARFVKAVDKMLPALMIELSGKTEWQRLDITLAMERENKVSMFVSDYIKTYYERMLSWLDEQNNIPKK